MPLAGAVQAMATCDLRAKHARAEARGAKESRRALIIRCYRHFDDDAQHTAIDVMVRFLRLFSALSMPIIYLSGSLRDIDIIEHHESSSSSTVKYARRRLRRLLS